jgi:hypothetical protein
MLGGQPHTFLRVHEVVSTSRPVADTIVTAAKAVASGG